MFGRPFDPDRISFAGKTDQQILNEILQQMGLDGAHDPDLYGRALELYRDTMVSILDESWVDVLPGIDGLLPRLAANSDIQLGLLTGNLRDTAYLKLRLGGIDQYFPFGAFGSDHADRYHLPPIAIGRAYDFTGYRYDGKEVVIIGDTEHDIGCSRSVRALAVAVCTGRYGRDELAEFGPDYLLDDLSDTDAVMAILASS